MNRRRLLLTFISVPALLPAADPWKDKKAAEWSSKDATRILTNSPWAKTASAEMDFSGMGGGPGGGGGMRGAGGGGMSGPSGGGNGGPPGGGMGGPPGGGMGGPPGGGMGGPSGGGMEPPKFLIRWESARPVREAAAKIEDANGAKITELSREFYVISTSVGTMPGSRRAGSDGEGQRPQPDFSRMQERMIQTTSLRIKGQQTIAPVNVEVLQNGRGMTTLFLFPRSAELAGDAKEVAFETSMGPMLIKAKFSLKDMMYEGQPAL